MNIGSCKNEEDEERVVRGFLRLDFGAGFGFYWKLHFGSFEASVCVVEVNTGQFQRAVRVIEVYGNGNLEQCVS